MKKLITMRVIPIGLCLIFLGIIGYNSYQKYCYQSEVRLQSKLENKLAKRQDVANKALLSQLKRQHYDNYRYLKMTSFMETQINQVFSILYTFSDYQSYNRRQKLLEKYLSKQLQQDNRLFAKPVDSSGGDYIGTLKISSKFVNSEVYLMPQANLDTVSSLVLVTYRAQTGNQEAGVGTGVYEVNYNLKSKQFTEINQVTRLNTKMQE
ncbi:hypothetical protein SY111_01080 [Ligilactobacillus agilis]|uniref:Uncharacterized protein n=1 Tax=Ligilactobacillus agilis TaxID=1601 RepID=A0A6F9YA49_9LACO|nr:hypothetical protein [Ligilactobacillus agilis]MCL8204224.1 hypothetical protein [Ligilactobacillus agilis]GET06925.1 hypothetical protein SY212_19550 [Ligilactobacillus agilis]GET07484.1 hypothetical protein SY111_01080 [Ligilactobacillus agilis]GET11200.1 hypothetical protein SN10121_16900 [Ligilactobacillus agilis]GET14366.1 hypothetical protein SN4111_06280 [Ligilactobacillus agilis]